MCGRFTMYADDQELVSLFDIDVVEGEHRPTYNQAPSQMVRAVRNQSDQQRQLSDQQWGFVPFWAKENFKPLINARAETVTEKPTFRTAVRKRRCLVPTNGYFEWQQRPGGKKQPYFLSLADSDGQPADPGSEPLLAMAGIYEWPRSDDPDEKAPATAALLTREAADTLGHIHQRMPLFIPRPLWQPWLDREINTPEEVAELIAAVPVAPLAPRMVSPAVGNVRNNFPGLIDPYTPPEERQDDLGPAEPGMLPGL